LEFFFKEFARGFNWLKKGQRRNKFKPKEGRKVFSKGEGLGRVFLNPKHFCTLDSLGRRF